MRPLDVTGHCGQATIDVIDEIQLRNLRMKRPDGRVDPSGATFRFLTANVAGSVPAGVAWGAKVSLAFKTKVIQVAGNLGVDPNYLMAAMAFESGETFSASVKNAAGSGAVGLIQFMPETATHLLTSTSALAAMTPETQLDYVEKFFNPYKGRLNSLGDVYMAILWPSAIGKPDDYALFKSPSKQYQQNKGLDANKDGVVTKCEAVAAVQAKLLKGERPGFLG